MTREPLCACTFVCAQPAADGVPQTAIVAVAGIVAGPVAQRTGGRMWSRATSVDVGDELRWWWVAAAWTTVRRHHLRPTARQRARPASHSSPARPTIQGRIAAERVEKALRRPTHHHHLGRSHPHSTQGASLAKGTRSVDEEAQSESWFRPPAVRTQSD